VFFARPPQGIPDDDHAWDMQEHCQALLADAGYGHYEVSAYARPGRRCAHNLNYWRYGDYIGIGAGAHGKITVGATQQILRRWKVKHPTSYLTTAGTQQAVGGDDDITPQRRPFEFMLNALRLQDGFALADFTATTGLPLDSIAPALEQALQAGWLEVSDTHVRPTALGRRFTNDVIELFLGD
jgi:coproporphyrinogen III oxidase-like Fe-S oxidoreductase